MINIPNILRDLRDKYRVWENNYLKQWGKKDEPVFNRVFRYSGQLFLLSIPVCVIYSFYFFYGSEKLVRWEMSKIPVPSVCVVYYDTGGMGKACYFGNIEEHGDGDNIKKIEKWLLNNGYSECLDGSYVRGKYMIEKYIYKKEKKVCLHMSYDYYNNNFFSNWVNMFSDIYRRIFDPEFYKNE